ncbi:CobD/CbiB family cobalamin biosynthesis protein [Fundidesulfovibrio terrae]|uniref:CobD/CbiB family cobalamin biosynthesis protein n=1 Tax=Fundidesulfovibrio terrae TaxID=2922866 RepID=UPI001FAF0A99|nr:CobD/CbiB family cobalamin biosynthesis protein [Fundidesulfovibrio terrae]
MDSTLFLPAAAFALDMALGDPHHWPHPVRLIGRALERLERLVQPSPPDRDKGVPGSPDAPGRKSGATPAAKRVFGALVAALLGLGVYALVAWLGRISSVGWIFSLYLAYAGLALGQLTRETRAVAALIGSGRLDEARAALAFLVSRDTSVLDEAGLWRTLAETASENFCDAFVAPMFFLCLGGPPLLWLYKTVSTMDSMWGYKTPRFADLGWAGARADDVLAYIPARLSACLLIAAGFLMGLPAGKAWASFRPDARKMASPNAGWPMAAAAWLCGASMGGTAVYFGRTVEKPKLGPQYVSWDILLFRTLTRLIFISGFGMVLLSELLLVALCTVFS